MRLQCLLKETPGSPGLARAFLGIRLLYALFSIISKEARGKWQLGLQIHPHEKLEIFRDRKAG
jgi:hypothetical protein